MTTRPMSISSALQLRLVVPGAAALPVRADLDYDASDPYAISVSFHTGPANGEVVRWTFARQLLSDGVAVPAGEGDVQVWPSAGDTGAVVGLSLSSPSGRAAFEVPLGDVLEFLGRTYEAVPPGGESSHVDIDAELALLLWVEPET